MQADVVLYPVEGQIFVSVGKLVEGGLAALYPPAATGGGPLYSMPYYPAYLAEWGALEKLLGGGRSILAGRLVALAALLAEAVVLASLLRRSGVRTVTIAALTLSWLAGRFMVAHAALALTDLPAIVWSSAGVYVIGRRLEEGRSTWPAAFLFAAALITKQSTAGGLIASAALLAWMRRPRQAVVLVATALVLVGLLAAAMQVVTEGGFAAQTVGGLRQPIDPILLGHRIKDFASGPLTWVVGALALLGAVEAVRTRIGSGANSGAGSDSASAWARLALLYAFATMAIALATVGKLGANYNYFLEPWVAACWLGGIGFERGLVRRRTIWAVAAALALALASLASVDDLLAGLRMVQSERETVRSARRELAADDLGGVILSESQLFPLVEGSGGEVYVNDLWVAALNWETGRWPVSRLERDLRCGRVSAVVVTKPLRSDRPPRTRLALANWNFWNSPVVIPRILEHYRLEPRRPQDVLFTYLPLGEGCPGEREG